MELLSVAVASAPNSTTVGVALHHGIHRNQSEISLVKLALAKPSNCPNNPDHFRTDAGPWNPENIRPGGAGRRAPSPGRGPLNATAVPTVILTAHRCTSIVLWYTPAPASGTDIGSKRLRPGRFRSGVPGRFPGGVSGRFPGFQVLPDRFQLGPTPFLPGARWQRWPDRRNSRYDGDRDRWKSAEYHAFRQSISENPVRPIPGDGRGAFDWHLNYATWNSDRGHRAVAGRSGRFNRYIHVAIQPYPRIRRRVWH